MTTIRVKLIRNLPDAQGSSFVLAGIAGQFSLFNKVGVRIQCAFFERNGTSLADPADILSATFTVVNAADATFMTQVKAGPFPAITTDQWNAGTGQHVEFVFSDVATAIAAGTYTAVVFGNEADGTAAVDYCCQRTLTIVDSKIPGAFTDPDDAVTVLAALKDYVNAQVAGLAKKVGAKGETISLRTRAGSAVDGRITLECIWDADKGALRIVEQEERL